MASTLWLKRRLRTGWLISAHAGTQVAAINALLVARN
jgi:hypothetical protein